MTGSLNQFVLVKARKSRGGAWWSPDDYDVRDNAGKVVGRTASPASTEIAGTAISMAVHIALNRRRSDRTFLSAWFGSD
jgi:hypothetical protein